jgi:hypothetical protein
MEQKLQDLRIKQEQQDYELEQLDQEVEYQTQIKENLLKQKQEKAVKEKSKTNIELNLDQNKNSNNFKKQKQTNTEEIFDNLSPEEKFKKIKNLVTSTKTSNIMDGTLNDYKILKKKLNTGLHNHKIPVKPNVVQTIQVKFDPLDVADYNPISIRIISEFYNVLDLLEEVCKYHGLDFRCFDICDEKEQKVPLTLSLKKYLEEKPADIISRFVQLKRDHKAQISDLEEMEKHLRNLNGGVKNFVEPKILTSALIKAEDDIINRLVGIIGYLFFLACVFTQSLSRFGIQQSYFIDDAVKTQIFEKPYYSDNVNGLSNNFANIMNIDDIYRWLDKVYPSIFEEISGKKIF